MSRLRSLLPFVLAACVTPPGDGAPCITAADCDDGAMCLDRRCLDRTPPRLVSVTPERFDVWVGTELRFTFDEPVVLGDGAVRVTPAFSIEARAADVSLDPDGVTVVVRPTDVRVPETLEVGFTPALTDRSGNAWGSAQTTPFEYPAWPRRDLRRVDENARASRVALSLAGGTRPMIAWLEGGFDAKLYARFVDDDTTPTPLNRRSGEPTLAGPLLLAAPTHADLLWVEGYDGSLTGSRSGETGIAELSTGLAGTFSELSGAHDSAGNAVISFVHDDALRVGIFRDGAWSTLGARVDVDGVPRLSPRIAIGSDDVPVIASVRGDDLEVRRWDGNAWSLVGGARLNGASLGFGAPALVADGPGTLCLAWIEGGDLVTRRWNGETWTAPVTVATDLGGNAVVHAHAESDGTTWLVWSDALRRITAAHARGDAWTTTAPLNALGPFAADFSSAVGDGVGPYVAWTDDEGRLHLARFNR